MLSFIPRPAVMSRLRAELQAVRERGRGRMVAVRGRRQMGKSTAVESFVEHCETPYVFATGLYRQPAQEQLIVASEAFETSANPLPGIEERVSPAQNWREWLGRVAVAASAGPVVVVLDEFPWMAAGGDTASLEGTVQSVWDRTLEKLPVFLVLIGSDIAMMERLAQHDRPLYGRFSELVVPPLNPAETALALPEASAFDVFDTYLVTGGYPRLLTDLVISGGSVDRWVTRSLLEATSPLDVTARLNLDAELADSTAAYRVLSAVGSSERGQLNLGAVAAGISGTGTATKAEETAAIRAVTQLVGKRLIEIEEPAWANSNRLRRYRVADTYFRFWFRYVERNLGAISRGRGDIAAAAFERDWQSWRGVLIEPTIRHALSLVARGDARLSSVDDVRPWWTRNGKVEVDAVGVSRDRSVFLATVKWRERGGVTADELRALSAVIVPRSERAELVAVCPSGAAPGSAISFSADDLLAAWAADGAD